MDTANPTVDVQIKDAKAADRNHETATGWTAVRRIADVLLLPCMPILFPQLPHPVFFPCSGRWSTSCSYAVTGTLLWHPQRGDNKVTLCLGQQEAAGSGTLLLDLPVSALELAEAGRVALECDRRWTAAAGGPRDGPLLAEPRWAVHCNGRRAGFTGPRAGTDAEALALEAVRPVSDGMGSLTPASGGERFKYLRATFDRVVGSVDCEAYHLVDSSGSLGLELSVFFFRIG